MTNIETWHNTGGNGPASAVWTRTVVIGDHKLTAVCEVMPFRTLVTIYRDAMVAIDGVPFETLTQAQGFADKLATLAQASPEHFTLDPRGAL